MSKYDIEKDELSFLSEKSNSSNNQIPETVEKTLSYGFGRCLVLATDENGYYFFGIYHLTDKDNNKYVNAVFYDSSNQNKILSLYEYFCNNQRVATEQLFDSLVKLEEKSKDSKLEYKINKDNIASIVSKAYDNSINKKMKVYPSNSLLAFITIDKYNDCENNLIEIFKSNLKKSFKYENLDVENNQIPNYQIAIKDVYKDLPIAIDSIIRYLKKAIVRIIEFLKKVIVQIIEFLKKVIVRIIEFLKQ